ncbi:ABC transporter permease [Spirillospora sp. NPDC029432]|uniref:ABC transporter permease n=1 Tax=Spirillospora sp. NPDC029432 TaxID=3154599 RepID=UPI003453E327
MKPLAIAGTELRVLLRDRSSLFFLFLLPMGLILVLGATFGGSYEPRLGVVDQGRGELSGALVRELDAIDGVRVERIGGAAELRTAVERGRLQAGVVVPAGYDAALRGDGRTGVELLARPDQDGMRLGPAVRAAVARQGERLRAARFARNEQNVPLPRALAATDLIAPRVPGVEVRTVTAGEDPFPETMGRFTEGAAGQLLLFVFLTSLTGTAVLIEGRRTGVIRRMLATPTAVRTILFGAALGRFGIALLQGVFIMAGSALIFGVDWGAPLPAVLVVLMFCLVGSGAAMVAGAVLRTEQQAGAIGVLLGLGLAALGGSMMPLEFFSPAMMAVARLTPHAWGNEALAELTRHGGGLADVLPELAVLGAYALVLFTAGTYLLRRSLMRDSAPG